MKNAKWNDLRARLHHDWLQKYFEFLTAWAEDMDGAIECHGIVSKDIVEQFGELSDKAVDFKALIDNAENALSPVQLLKEYPFDRMSDENKKWLGEVIHLLYCERTGIKKKAEGLREKFKFIYERHALLSEILEGKNDEFLKKAGKEPFRNFYGQMQEFSHMVSALPHEVQLV